MLDHFSSALASIHRCSKQKQVATTVPNTKLIRQVLVILERLGYLRGYMVLSNAKMKVFSKFDENKHSVIRSLGRVSKPGSRVYISYKKLSLMNKNINAVDSYKTTIISTSKGLLTTQEALDFKIGGELLFYVN